MSSTDLALTEDSAPAVSPPTVHAAIAEVQRIVRELAPREAADALGVARAKAEAATLYEQRRDNAERERYYGKLRLVAEAGLGVLAYNGVGLSGIPGHQVQSFKVLAAAFERGRLLECAEGGTALNRVATEARRRGMMHVAHKDLPRHSYRIGERVTAGVVTWAYAREVCAECGVDPTQLPLNTTLHERAVKSRRNAHAQRNDAHARMREHQRRRRIARAAAGSPAADTYGYIRQALDALGRVSREELPVHRRAAFDRTFSTLYGAEDAIAEAFALDGEDLGGGRRRQGKS